MAYELVKEGTETSRGTTGQIVERGLKRLDLLIDRSLTGVRLNVDPKIIAESGYLLQM